LADPLQEVDLFAQVFFDQSSIYLLDNQTNSIEWEFWTVSGLSDERMESKNDARKRTAVPLAAARFFRRCSFRAQTIAGEVHDRWWGERGRLISNYKGDSATNLKLRVFAATQ